MHSMAVSYETRDMNITAGDDVAFSHGLCHVSATMTDGGRQIDMWWRSTISSARSIGTGWSRTSITRCPSIQSAAKRRLI
jgi:ketosteroid isomerase-like protein